MEGHDAEGVLGFGCGDFRLSADLFPPGEEAVDVGAFTLGVVGGQVEEGLDEDELVRGEVGAEDAAERLYGFVEGAMTGAEPFLAGVGGQWFVREGCVGGFAFAADAHGVKEEGGGVGGCLVVWSVQVAQHARDEADGG